MTGSMEVRATLGPPSTVVAAMSTCPPLQVPLQQVPCDESTHKQAHLDHIVPPGVVASSCASRVFLRVQAWKGLVFCGGRLARPFQGSATIMLDTEPAHRARAFAACRQRCASLLRACGGRDQQTLCDLSVLEQKKPSFSILRSSFLKSDPKCSILENKNYPPSGQSSPRHAVPFQFVLNPGLGVFFHPQADHLARKCCVLPKAARHR